MGLITPGPVVIMATFAGYLVHGVLGATVATLAVFLPVYLFVVIPGPLFRRYEKHPRLIGFVKGATAAAAGAIAGAAIVIAEQTISGPLTAAIGLVALGVPSSAPCPRAGACGRGPWRRRWPAIAPVTRVSRVAGGHPRRRHPWNPVAPALAKSAQKWGSFAPF